MDVVEQYHQNEYSDTIVQFLRESANRSKELFPNEDEINHVIIPVNTITIHNKH